jgi:hypothetical protein
VKYALQTLKGRILMNLNRPTDVPAAVAGVPTTFRYDQLHAQTAGANTNQFWSFNNVAGRYSVSTSEGTNGVNFALANDPRLPVCAGNDTRCRTMFRCSGP